MTNTPTPLFPPPAWTPPTNPFVPEPLPPKRKAKRTVLCCVLAVSASMATGGALVATAGGKPNAASAETETQAVVDRPSSLASWAATYNGELQTMSNTMTDDMRAIADAADRTDVYDLTVACATLSNDVDDFQASSASRDVRAPQLWATMLDDAQTAAHDCLTGDYAGTASAASAVGDDATQLAAQVRAAS